MQAIEIANRKSEVPYHSEIAIHSDKDLQDFREFLKSHPGIVKLYEGKYPLYLYWTHDDAVFALSEFMDEDCDGDLYNSLAELIEVFGEDNVAQEIMTRVGEEFDATVGVSWDTFETIIRMFAEEQVDGFQFDLFSFLTKEDMKNG